MPCWELRWKNETFREGKNAGIGTRKNAIKRDTIVVLAKGVSIDEKHFSRSSSCVMMMNPNVLSIVMFLFMLLGFCIFLHLFLLE
jgi:hypothetical protein